MPALLDLVQEILFHANELTILSTFSSIKFRVFGVVLISMIHLEFHFVQAEIKFLVSFYINSLVRLAPFGKDFLS